MARSLALAVSLVGLAGEAAAGDAADGGARADGGAPDGGASDADPAGDPPRPPELAAPAAPEYPPAALAAGLEATVMVKVDVDVEGRVTDAAVVRPVGNGFDEAARAAALRARFRPARRGGRAIPSRIAMRVEFRLPVTAAAPAVVTVPPSPVAPELARPRKLMGPLSPLDVTVRGESSLDRRRHSAEAVTIIDLERAKRQAADMGDVLSRAEGVSVRQEGGLGSYTRISINGLVDDQVRYFLDGVPLELAGYPFGVANIPVNLIENIEIYKGVLPIRFAADALGGAFNLVSDQDVHGTRIAASYKVGSFDTHRLTLSARHMHEPSGFFVRASGFFDYALNNYRVDVEVPDAEGQLMPASVYRFHDKYRAAGANVELGFADRSWAKRLILRAFVTDYDKDYQHNFVMTVPYGGVTYGETLSGVSLRYEQTFKSGFALEVVGAYAYLTGRFQDLATCVYDWYGRCVRERRLPGELDGRPHDQTFRGHGDYVRALLTWRPAAWQAVRVSLAPPRIATRTGDERRQLDPASEDKFNSVRRLYTMVNGAEYQVDLVGGRLENIAFGKQYLQVLDSNEVGGSVDHRTRSTFRFGVGDGVRYRIADWLWLKSSYEWSTRLPRPDEVFGDNAFILPNSELQPEVSHNGNLGFDFDHQRTRLGSFNAHVNGFARFTENQIVRMTTDRMQIYRNVFRSRSVGVESKLGWRSPRDLLVIDGTFTWQDFRNTSSQGTFGAFEGDRIPNKPYLDGFGTARLQLQNVYAPHDEISLYWSTRYVHSFFRSWESIGLPEFKQVIPTQVAHTVGLGYFVRNATSNLSVDLELQNLTDARVYDFFGTQRPGRGFFVKTTAEF